MGIEVGPDDNLAAVAGINGIRLDHGREIDADGFCVPYIRIFALIITAYQYFTATGSATCFYVGAEQGDVFAKQMHAAAGAFAAIDGVCRKGCRAEQAVTGFNHDPAGVAVLVRIYREYRAGVLNYPFRRFKRYCAAIAGLSLRTAIGIYCTMLADAVGLNCHITAGCAVCIDIAIK